MLEKYGRPSQFDRRTLVWFNNGNWKRTIVYRNGCPNSRPGGNENLEQTVGYLVPRIRAASFKRFSPRLAASESAGEVTFCSESEAANLLAINLADEIAVGRRTANEARDVFERTGRLTASGKSTRLNAGLVFEVDNTRAMTPTGGDR